MNDRPQTREQYSAHLPALHLLCNLGWRFLTTSQCLELRGTTREVLLKPRLIEVLKTRRFEYKGEWFPLSPSGIDQIVREISAVNLGEGLLPANERLYAKLLFGITVTEFMPDGKKHCKRSAVPSIRFNFRLSSSRFSVEGRTWGHSKRSGGRTGRVMSVPGARAGKARWGIAPITASRPAVWRIGSSVSGRGRAR